MNTSVTLISVITMYLGLPETQTTGLKLERERDVGNHTTVKCEESIRAS